MNRSGGEDVALFGDEDDGVALMDTDDPDVGDGLTENENLN